MQRSVFSAAKQPRHSIKSAARTNAYRAIRGTDVTEYRAGAGSIWLDARKLDHFAPLLSLISDELAEVGGRAGSTVPPRSASRVFILGSARAALISLLSLLDDL